MPKVPSYEEAVQAQQNVIDQSIMQQDEEIMPIKKTYQEFSQPFSSSSSSWRQPSSDLQSNLQDSGRHGNVTPEAPETKSAVSGLGS